MSGAALGELDRRLANLVRVGHVAELDEANARVKIECGDLKTDWMQWTQSRAGGDRTWHAPEVGEQVVFVAPSGDMAQGVVIGSVPQDAHPPAGTSKDKHRTVYSDGSFVEYDRAAHHYTVNIVPGAGVTVICQQATVQASDSVTIDTPQTTCTGALTVEGLLTYQAGMTGTGGGTVTGGLEVTGGSVTHNGVNIGDTHTHTGVQPGGSTTGAPS